MSQQPNITARTGQGAHAPALRVGFVGDSHDPESPDKPPFAASISDAVTLERWGRIYAGGSKEAAASRAAFIVRACNSYDALISLANLVIVAETDYGFGCACFDLPRLESILEQARKALKLAKEGQQ